MIGPTAITSHREPWRTIGTVVILHDSSLPAWPCVALVDWISNAQEHLTGAARAAGGQHVVYPCRPSPPEKLQLLDVDFSTPLHVLTPEQARRLRSGAALYLFVDEPDPLWPRSR